MIVSPDGLNVYPEDVERVLNAIAGVRESAVVAEQQGAREQVHAVLVLEPGTEAESVVQQANAQLETHQRIRGFSVWPNPPLPRTSGTNKLKRVEISKWVEFGPAVRWRRRIQRFREVLRRFAGGRKIDLTTPLEDLALSSLDRIQLLMELEQRTGTSVNESQFAAAKNVADLMRAQPAAVEESFDFPEWNRSLPARWLRRIALPGLILPLARMFAWIRTEGLSNLQQIEPPVIFASNHQSHFDVPAIMAALPPKWRYRVSPAMAKEFFDAHFHPARYPASRTIHQQPELLSVRAGVSGISAAPARGWHTRSAALRGRPGGRRELHSDLPRRQADGPRRNPAVPGGCWDARIEATTFPVVPVRLEGLEKVLHKSAKFATPGKARVKFGPAMRFGGTDYAAIAKEIEEAVRRL